jgi:hypothetical protein
MGATATESKQFSNIAATTVALRCGRQGEIRFRKSVADFHYRLPGE